MLLVFGSINVDMLLRVEALPRPGETVLCPGYELAPGGKGANQAAAAAKAGGRVRMIGRIGEDDFGALARDSLEAAGVDCRGVLLSGRPSGTAVIGVDRHGENQIIVASGANLEVDADQVKDSDLTAEVTVLCQNEVPPEATFALIEQARAQGARTILNLAPAGAVPAAVLDALDILVVNQIEAAAAAGVGGGDPVALARDLARRHRLACIVTLGAAGAIAVTPDGGGWRVGALPVEPLDTTGAGDAFTGVLAAALEVGAPLPQALHQASVAAGLTCRQLGAQTAQPAAAAIEAHLAQLAEPVPLA